MHGCRHVLFAYLSFCTHLSQDMEHVISVHNLWTSHEYLNHYPSEHSCAHEVVIQIMLTVELRITSILGAHSPISFKFIAFWCPFLDLHLTPYHLNIQVSRLLLCWIQSRLAQVGSVDCSYVLQILVKLQTMSSGLLPV